MSSSCLVVHLAATVSNGNAVGQLPVMGWSGYNAFMQNSGHCDRAGASGYNETTLVLCLCLLPPSLPLPPSLSA